MRGNEALLGDLQHGDQQRFPIPMRGNELPPLVKGALPTKFPIPMRGNETHELVIDSVADNGFPIPMRGNEEREAECGRCHRTGFRSP